MSSIFAKSQWLAGRWSLMFALAVLLGCKPETDEANSCCEDPASGTTAVQTSGPANSATAASPGAPRDETLASVWRAPAERPSLSLSHLLTRHDGVAVDLSSLIGQPLAISFAYTRCMNPNKCRAVTTTMGALRQQLKEAGLLEQVKLVLITYDALYDTPKVMRDYAEKNHLVLDDRLMYLRPAVDPKHRLFRDLGVTASFNATGVSLHGIQLLLLDKQGRLARTYRTLIWDNEQVVKDLERLAREEPMGDKTIANRP
jgi:protein SCO1/2